MLVGILFGMFVQKPASDDMQSENIDCLDNQWIANDKLEASVYNYSSHKTYDYSKVKNKGSQMLFYESYDLRRHSQCFTLTASQHEEGDYRRIAMITLFFRPPPILS